jgi:hypothetical protein
MNLTFSKLFLGTTLFAFATAACTGGEDAAPIAAASHPAGTAGETTTPPSSPSLNPSPAPSSTSSNGPATSQDAGIPVPTRTLALHCQAPVPNGNAVCLETAEGHAGDVVDLEVHLLRPAACGTAEYAMGNIQVDPTKFEITNADYQQDCLKREQSPVVGNPSLDVIFWQAFDRSVAPTSCTASAGVGKVDVIKVRIKPGTPPGDYDLPFENSELLGGGPGCSGVFLDVAGMIRVLP